MKSEEELEKEMTEETLRIVKQIEKEEQFEKNYELFVQEIERHEDGLFHLFCGVCEKEYTTPDYKQYFCSKDCEWLNWYERHHCINEE